MGIEIYEEAVPIRGSVVAAAEILGLDPFYIANEGKLIAILPPAQAEAVLAAMKKNPYGQDAAVIGEVKAENPGKVVMKTIIGGKSVMARSDAKSAERSNSPEGSVDAFGKDFRMELINPPAEDQKSSEEDHQDTEDLSHGQQS